MTHGPVLWRPMTHWPSKDLIILISDLVLLTSPGTASAGASSPGILVAVVAGQCLEGFAAPKGFIR